jgi:hypothetical protein
MTSMDDPPSDPPLRMAFFAATNDFLESRHWQEFVVSGDVTHASLAKGTLNNFIKEWQHQCEARMTRSPEAPPRAQTKSSFL